MKKNHPTAIVFFLLWVLLCSISSAGAATYSVQDLKKLMHNIEKDAQTQIQSIHGTHALFTIKKGLKKEFNIDSLPLPVTGDPCPAVGFNEDDIGAIIQASPLNQAGVYYIFGTEACLKGFFTIAKWAFAKASQMALQCPTNLNNLGFVLNRFKDYKHAAIILEYAKTLDPGDASIHVNLAHAYKNLNRYDEAIREIMFAISFHPRLAAYKIILQELRRLKKEKRQYQIVDSKKPAAAPQVEDALDMLEEKKLEDDQEESAYAFDLPIPGYREQRRPAPRKPANDFIHGFDPSAFGAQDDACGFFKSQMHILIRMGDGAVEKSGQSPPGGSPVQKFLATGNAHIEKSKQVVSKIDNKSYKSNKEVIQDVAAIGALETANIFYGVASEMYDLCGESEPDPQMNKLLDAIAKERENWAKNFFKEMDKEKFSKPVCTGKICVAKGDQGSTKISIQDGILGTDIQIHPTNIYKYQLKVSMGGNIVQKGAGSLINASVGSSQYFEYKFGRGLSAGSELNVGVAGGKLVSTKAGKSFSLTKYDFEN